MTRIIVRFWRPSILLVPLVVLGSSPNLLADWPEFRGPTGQGLADKTNPPSNWGTTQNVVWKREVQPGWSSPTIVNGKIYLTSAAPKSATPKADQSLRVICLDARTGDTIWDRELFVMEGSSAPPIHKKNSHASPTPIVADGRVYVHFGHLGTGCLDASDGKVLWSTQEHAYKPVHGNGGSPILTAGKLIFSIDGTDKQEILALDANTGKVSWRTPRKAAPQRPFSFSTPLLIQVKGKPQVVSPGSDTVMACDPETGKEIWRANYPGGYSVVPRPIFFEGMVYICTGYNTPMLMAIRTDGTGDVTSTHVAWTVKKNVPHNPSLLIVDGLIYMVSDAGMLSCLDAKSGEVIWNERVGSAFSSSPLYAGGKIYLMAEDGTSVVFKPGRSYEPIATNKLGEKSLASFGLDCDALLIRTEKHLYKIAGK